MTEKNLTGPQLRKLKSLAQHLEPVAKVGKQGVTPAFIQSLLQILAHHELIKLKFTEFKEEKKALAAEIAEKTGSHFVWMVGHVAIFYREHSDPAQRRILGASAVSE